MKICNACLTKSKKENWYPFSDAEKSLAANCEIHPVLTNWRVIRTLKTIRAWSLEADGYSVALTRTAKMPVQMGGGHIHERTARAKLFDYEGPFIDLLIQEKLVLRHEGTPRTLTVTAAGDETIRTSLLEREVKDGVKTTAHFKKWIK